MALNKNFMSYKFYILRPQNVMSVVDPNITKHFYSVYSNLNLRSMSESFFTRHI